MVTPLLSNIMPQTRWSLSVPEPTAAPTWICLHGESHSCRQELREGAGGQCPIAQSKPTGLPLLSITEARAPCYMPSTAVFGPMLPELTVGWGEQGRCWSTAAATKAVQGT
jgi:hypothetical protein